MNDAQSINLEQFEHLARSRRAVRHFKPDPLPEGLLERLLDVAHWAPSGYNLQPVQFVVVDDPAIKPALRRACLDQQQITEAPATVVFLANRRAVEDNFEEVLRLDREAGAITPEYERLLRKVIPLAFGHRPLGLQRVAKFVLAPVLRLFAPTPEIPAAHLRLWLTRQTMLAAMTFMLAARSAGLGTCPMEGFDELRVRRVLSIPRRFIVPVIIPVGYPSDEKLIKTRLPVEKMVCRNCMA